MESVKAMPVTITGSFLGGERSLRLANVARRVILCRDAHPKRAENTAPTRPNLAGTAQMPLNFASASFP